MDEQITAAARANGGIVPTASLGSHVGRSARALGLVAVQPRALIAQTQPVGPTELVAAVRTSREEGIAFIGSTALWLYGVASPPERISVGVLHSTRYRALPTVQVRRLSPQVLRGTRTINQACVVALEVAVVQACEKQPPPVVRELVERVLRDRRSTMTRLRGRCRRGVGGSAAVRRAIDELAGTSLDAAVRRLRTALTARGVTGLRTEVHFVSAQGASAYVDLLDEQSQTAVEVDGYLTHIERDRFRADRRRDRWMHMEHGILTARVDVAETLAGDPLEAVADEISQPDNPQDDQGAARALGRGASGTKISNQGAAGRGAGARPGGWRAGRGRRSPAYRAVTTGSGGSLEARRAVITP